MPTRYEDLTGGFGPIVNFRAKRVLARKFLEHQTLKLVLDGVIYDLHDISMNGVSFYAKEGQQWSPNDEPFDMTLTVQDKYEDPAEPEEVYSSQAKVARVKPTSRGERVGLELVGGFLNLPKIHWDYEEGQLAQSIAQGPELIHGSVPPEYREQVEQTVHFIQFYRRMLTHHEQRYAEVGDTAAVDTMIDRTFDQIKDVWKEICRRHSVLLTKCLEEDRTIHRVIREYTETMVTSRLMDCPSFRTAYTKPMGYAGDFQIMDYFYRSSFEGQSAFARVFHRLGCEDAMAAGIRSRMDLIEELTRKQYSRFVSTSVGQDEFKVTSLGSGPAKEVANFVEAQQGWKRPVKWTLIDQEEKALGRAHDDIYPRIYRRKALASLQCMYMSFTDLMRDPENTKLQEQQHFIYLSGVLDYFKQPKAKALIRRLYEDFLARGGMLAVGNARIPNEHFWIAEFVVDWSLFYRTEEIMLDLADGLDCVDKEVISETVGAYHFLVLRKP